MIKKEDQYYISQILNGDTNAFAILVNRYKDLVYTLAIKIVKNREEAEEVSQDVFIKIFNSLFKFKGDSKFSTWIYKITYNTSLDYLKKYKKVQIVDVIDEFIELNVKDLEDAFSILEEKERKQSIQECLNLLPNDDNFLLTLYYFEEKSLEEIALVLEINSNNVKIKLFRARKKLAIILKEKLELETITYYEAERR